MIRSGLLILVVCGVALGQLFDRPATYEDRKSVAPPPTLVEMPYEKTTMPNLGPAAIAEETSRFVNVASPMIDVPKGLDSVVEIPHAPIPLPKGGVEETPMEYKVPQPIIRHRPILYKVPHVVKLHRPIVKHEKIFYNVPQAQLKPKSGYN